MVAGVIGYGVMVLVMTATPLAMQGCGFDFGSTASVIQWHVLGMFVPSLFTGKLIARFGTTKVIQAGCLFLLAALILNQFGITYWHFFFALVMLGIGWNFTFIGATNLLSKTYQPSDKAKVQGLNDFLVFAFAAIASMLAGYWQSALGWEMLNMLMIPAVIIAMACVFFSTNKSKQQNALA